MWYVYLSFNFVYCSVSFCFVSFYLFITDSPIDLLTCWTSGHVCLATAIPSGTLLLGNLSNVSLGHFRQTIASPLL